MTSETDPDLGPVPDALAAGRERAFSDVYDRYANRLYRVALTITRSQTDAEDAVHDTFLALWSSRTSWTCVDSLNAYLFVSLRHAAQRIAKRRRSLPASAAQRPLRNALQEDSGRDDVLHHAIDALPDAQREILVLKIDGELTFSEIAAVVGVNANTVASRYRLALESLRTKLKHDA